MEATDAAVAIERSAVARFALEYWRAAAAAAAFDRRTAVLPLQTKLLPGITSRQKKYAWYAYKYVHTHTYKISTRI